MQAAAEQGPARNIYCTTAGPDNISMEAANTIWLTKNVAAL